MNTAEVSHAKLLYTVVVAETLSGLVESVHAAMVEGWRCAGGPFESLEDGMCQAMYRDPAHERLGSMLDMIETITRSLMPKPPCPKCGAPLGMHTPECPDAYPLGYDLFGQRNRSN